MADTKITALAAISSVDPAVDPLAIVDVSDTSMAASGTTKKITSNQILGAGGVATLASATITGAATVGTTFGVTGASTFTGAATFNGAATLNGNTTLGDAQTDTATINSQLTARQGEFPSAVRAAASNYAAVMFDGATTSTRITSTLTGQAIGTGDFSIWCRFKISQTTAKAVFSVFEDSNNYFGLTTSSGPYGLDKTIGGVASNATITGFSGAAFAGQIVDFVLVRSAGVFSVYVNGSAYALSNTTGNISLSAAANLRVGGYFVASQVFDKEVYRFVVFNRALSAADVVEVGTTGVNPADQWGTQTAAYTSDFSAGTNGWAGVRGTAAGNVDGISGVDNTLRLTVDSTASNSHYLVNGTVPGLLASKRYRVAFDYFITAANATMNGLQLWQLSPQLTITTIQSVTGAWTSITPVEFVSRDTRLDVLGAAAGNVSFTGNGTDTLYIVNMVLTRIGAIVDLDFTVGAGYQSTDRTTNNLHGTLFNGVEFTVPTRMAVLYATTNTNGNQQMLGTLAIPTNAIIEDIIVNSTGSATVSVGNASAGTQIVNGASVVSGRQKLTLATPFSTTGNLWVNSSSTATLQFTILYTIAS
jgi:hypothetical protein